MAVTTIKPVTVAIALVLALVIAVPVQAAAPQKFEKECVKALSKSQKKRPRGELESFCRCVTEGGERLGFTRTEFAIERERISRNPDGVASGRIRQINNKCLDDMSRTTTARARL